MTNIYKICLQIAISYLFFIALWRLRGIKFPFWCQQLSVIVTTPLLSIMVIGIVPSYLSLCCIS